MFISCWRVSGCFVGLFKSVSQSLKNGDENTRVYTYFRAPSFPSCIFFSLSRKDNNNMQEKKEDDGKYDWAFFVWWKRRNKTKGENEGSGSSYLVVPSCPFFVDRLHRLLVSIKKSRAKVIFVVLLVFMHVEGSAGHKVEMITVCTPPCHFRYRSMVRSAQYIDIKGSSQK